MASLGIKTYRLSIAWPRIYPQGDGELNPKGHRLPPPLRQHEEARH